MSLSSPPRDKYPVNTALMGCIKERLEGQRVPRGVERAVAILGELDAADWVE